MANISSARITVHFRVGLRTEETIAKVRMYKHSRCELKFKMADRIDEESYDCTAVGGITGDLRTRRICVMFTIQLIRGRGEMIKINKKSSN